MAIIMTGDIPKNRIIYWIDGIPMKAIFETVGNETTVGFAPLDNFKIIKDEEIKKEVQTPVEDNR